METKQNLLIDKMLGIYRWLDAEIAANINVKSCDGCGQCCEYEKFGHRIYITNLELLYLKANLDGQPLKKTTDGKCPYMHDKKCSVRDWRFGACRIFFCKAEPDFQQSLSEEFLKKIKLLCVEFDVDYRYMNLPEMLSL